MNSILLVIDREAQDDLLLWSSVARAVAVARPTRLAILHAPGETAGRALEGQGFDADLPLGDEPDEARSLVRRALLEENRRAAQALTDEGVAAVAMPGSARNLLGDGPAPWFAQAVRTGTVPVVSAILALGDRLVEVGPERAAERLESLLDAPVLKVRLASVPGPPDARDDVNLVVTTVSGLASALTRTRG